MKVGVIGAGHVGLPTAATLAHIGHEVAATDAAVVCTEWEQVVGLDLDRVREAMALPVVVDGLNVFDPDEMSSHRFTYLPTGRPAIRP
jgi:UDP-glucose 6-dehydrogenase